MTVPDSLPQRIYLLAYDPAKGKVRIGTGLGAMLRAAALAELHLHGHLIDENSCAAVDTRHPGHDPFLKGVLDEIAGSKPRKWQYWIDSRQGAAVKAVRQQLSDGGWVRLQPRKVLGLFPATKVTLRDPRARKELLTRVKSALKNPIGRIDPANPADAAMVAIVAAADLRLVLDRKTQRANERRIQELTKLSGPIAPALHESLRQAALGGEA